MGYISNRLIILKLYLDLVHWHLKSYVFSSKNFPIWARSKFYAPEIHYVDGQYLVYYAAAREDDKHSVGVAVSHTGPFGKYKVVHLFLKFIYKY